MNSSTSIQTQPQSLQKTKVSIITTKAKPPRFVVLSVVTARLPLFALSQQQTAVMPSSTYTEAMTLQSLPLDLQHLDKATPQQYLHSMTPCSSVLPALWLPQVKQPRWTSFISL